MVQVEALKKRKEEIKLAGDLSSANRHMKVCDICGAMQAINDTEKRALAHLEGKLHTGFAILRRELEILKKRREELKNLALITRKEKEKEREKERDNNREREKPIERSREKSHSRDRHDRRRHRDRRSHSRSRSYRRSRSRDRKHRNKKHRRERTPSSSRSRSSSRKHKKKSHKSDNDKSHHKNGDKSKEGQFLETLDQKINDGRDKGGFHGKN